MEQPTPEQPTPEQIAQQMDQKPCNYCGNSPVKPGSDFCPDCIIPCVECGADKAEEREDLDDEYYCDDCYQNIIDQGPEDPYGEEIFDPRRDERNYYKLA